MKVFNRVNAFQSGPILKPDHIGAPTSAHEGLVDVFVDFLPDLGKEVAFWIRGVGGEAKLRPNDQMDNASVYAVGEVIVEDLEVVCKR